jgi:hypothetical protein
VRPHLEDVAFLLAQGELDYARRTRVMLDADAYAAALYRIGEYSNDSPARRRQADSLQPGPNSKHPIYRVGRTGAFVRDSR